MTSPEPLIYWQDEQLVVCCKPAGILSQGDGSKRSMETVLQEKLGGVIYPVHRLDQVVGGVMVYAKTAQAAAFLSGALQQGRFSKEYYAICQGTPAAGLWEDLLFHDKRAGKAYVVRRARNGVKSAALTVRPLQAGVIAAKPVTLCRVKLETGRFHQIRVQFASRGFPLVGDGRYGSTVKCALGLFAFHLSFPHPNGTQMDFTAPMPDAAPWNQMKNSGQSSD